MAAKKEQANKPPYIAYTTLINTVKKFSEGGLPGRIDTSLFKGQSNSTIAGLISAYKYLGLMNEAGAPSETLRSLVSVIDDDKGRAAAIREILESRFTFLAPSTIDLTSATAQQVQHAFQEQGMTGSSVTKGMSFYLAAAADAGIALSKYIKAPSAPKGTGTPRKKRKKGSQDEIEHRQPLAPATPTSAAELLLAKFPSFDPEWSSDIKKQWFESFATLQTHMLTGGTKGCDDTPMHAAYRCNRAFRMHGSETKQGEALGSLALYGKHVALV